MAIRVAEWCSSISLADEAKDRMHQVVFQVEKKWLQGGLSLYTYYRKKKSAGMGYSIFINEIYAKHFT